MRPDHSRLLLILCSACLATWASAHAQQGHRVTTRSVVVNTAGSSNSPVLQLGLGTAAAVDSLHVHWPGGVSQRFSDLPINCLIRVTEGDARYQILRRRP